MATPKEDGAAIGIKDKVGYVSDPESQPKHEPIVELIDPVKERALVWKFDLRILPFLSIIYLCNALDKSNLSNAKTAGLEKSLGMVGEQYSQILTFFIIPYVLTSPFLSLAGRKFGVNRVLPLVVLAFGTCTLTTVGAYNFSGLFAIRWFLGMAESAVFPLVIYYQTLFYRRRELGRRLSIFYAAHSFASAFSGLLAYGVFHIEGGPLTPWRYLFLIEGTFTVLLGFFVLWYLPRSAEHCSFLNEEEKELARLRLITDSSSSAGVTDIEIRESLKVFAHPTTWVIMLIELCVGVPLNSVNLFLPQIVGRLGYGKVKTNLYTVAPAISGGVMLLILGFASDYTKLRFPFVAAGFAFTFIGMMIFVAIDFKSSLNTAYFATFMMNWGTFAPSVLLDVWYNNNTPHDGRRLLLTSCGIAFANLSGIIPLNIFRNKDAPKYIPALTTSAAFGATGFVLTCGLGVYMMWDNNRRDKRQGIKLKPGDVPTERLQDGPGCEEFRWMY
ncbi:putative transporter [Lachnellula hyalina]|uniref:Putative transporter n=1 Tax=Lachnellula hyalina TaxID=1316788 RepID=A0A8H8TZ58_9HELO|nr:putative transporter [Lachnellula hyalina]TVY27939.1 putative transporter [Lachnellula hyalina]